jgi:hypothetical protein
VLQGGGAELAEYCLDDPQCGGFSIRKGERPVCWLPASIPRGCLPHTCLQQPATYPLEAHMPLAVALPPSPAADVATSFSMVDQFITNATLGFFRNSTDPLARVLQPISVLYVRTAGPTPSSAALSAGAIAGIAVGGCVVVVGVLAAATWLVVRRGRSRLQLAAAAGPKYLESGGSGASSYLGEDAACRPGKDSNSGGIPISATGLAASRASSARNSGGTASGHHSGGTASGGGAARANSGGSGDGGSKDLDKLPVLFELADHVARQEALACDADLAAAASGPIEHRLVSVETLPPRLREWVVDPSAITFLRRPNGALWEVGSGARWALFRKPGWLIGWQVAYAACLSGEVRLHHFLSKLCG